MKFAMPLAFGHSAASAGKHSDTMSRLSRRSFLAASAALVAAPALSAASSAAEVDVVIVGAGAAGIAAARRLAAANRSFRLFEAANRVGGRCATDTKIFGVPFDLGAHWIHNPDSNPLVAAAGQSGLEIYPAPRAQTLRVGPRNARDGELEMFLATTLKARRALGELGKAKTDMPASRLLPKDLGDWQATMEFMLGPFATGKDLKDMSAFDLARAVERDSDAFCRQGYGALLAKLAAGLPVQLSTPVGLIYWGGNALAVDTPKGNLLTRAVILTVSTNVLAEDKIEFIPTLPKRQADAAEKLALGSYDHIALEMPGNPLDLQRDDMVFEQSSGPAHGGAARQCRRHEPASGRGRRLIRPRAGQQGRGRDDRVRARLAGLAVRLRRQARDQAQPCHQLGRRSARARRHVGGGDRPRRRAQDFDGADRRQDLVRRRGAARDAMGHGHRRLGIRHARGRSGAAQVRRAEGAGRGQAGAPAAVAA